MANFIQKAVNRLINATRGVSIKLGDLAEYDITPQPTVVDLSANQLITKAMAIALSGGGNVFPAISIPAGSARPFTVDCLAGDYESMPVNSLLQVELLNVPIAGATDSIVIGDVSIHKFYTDDTLSALDHIEITGHADPADITGATTIDDLLIYVR